MSLLPLLCVAVANFRQGGDAPERIIENRIRDVTMTIHIVQAIPEALKQVGNDLAALYLFKSAQIRIKEPMCLRVDVEAQGLQICYVINGTLRTLRMPGMLQQQDLASAPGRLQCAFDLGLVTRSIFDKLYRADYVETEAKSGLLVYDFRFRSNVDASHSRVWIDPNRRFIVRRDWFDQKGVLRARGSYSDPIEIDGCWIPTKAELRDRSGRLAGQSVSEKIELNKGLADSLFQ